MATMFPMASKAFHLSETSSDADSDDETGVMLKRALSVRNGLFVRIVSEREKGERDVSVNEIINVP